MGRSAAAHPRHEDQVLPPTGKPGRPRASGPQIRTGRRPSRAPLAVQGNPPARAAVPAPGDLSAPRRRRPRCSEATSVRSHRRRGACSPPAHAQALEWWHRPEPRPATIWCSGRRHGPHPPPPTGKHPGRRHPHPAPTTVRYQSQRHRRYPSPATTGCPVRRHPHPPYPPCTTIRHMGQRHGPHARTATAGRTEWGHGPHPPPPTIGRPSGRLHQRRPPATTRRRRPRPSESHDPSGAETTIGRHTTGARPWRQPRLDHRQSVGRRGPPRSANPRLPVGCGPICVRGLAPGSGPSRYFGSGAGMVAGRNLDRGAG